MAKQRRVRMDLGPGARSQRLWWLGLTLSLLWFVPVEAQQSRPIRIMPVGDSLTASIDGQASYRYWLWRGLALRGCWFDFVGSQSGVGSGMGPAGFDRQHEGHAGATAEDIRGSIYSLAAQARPDVVLLLIGANDLGDGASPNTVLQTTLQIISRIRAVNPNVTILWALLPPAFDQMAAARQYDLGVLRLAPLISTPNSPVRVVNLYTGFDPNADTVDGIHPNVQGERKFAYRFLVALMPVIWQFRGY